MMNSILALSLLSLLPSALAHGNIKSFNGVAQPPIGSNTPGSTREVTSMDPITDLTSLDMSCGNGAYAFYAQKTSAVSPGGNMDFLWISGAPPALWPHNMGPMMTYIASCGTDCTTFNSTQAKWLKIGQAGYTVAGTKLGDPAGIWTMGATAYKGLAYSLALPSSIPNGQYLIRHENIALHRANTAGGAEVYPSCTQITVTGGQDGTLPTENAVSFPGAYKATDPGILVDVYTPSTAMYQFPGPALFSDSASTSSTGTDNAAGGSSSGTPVVTTTAALTTPVVTQPATITASASTASATSDACDEDDGSDDSLLASTPASTASDSTFTGTADPSGDDGDNGGTVTVYETVTVTVPASHRHTKTEYLTMTVTADGGDATLAPSSTASAATITPDPTTTLNPATRRMKRVHAKKHFWQS